MGIRTHSQLPTGRELRQLWDQRPASVEELVGAVAAKPLVEQAEVLFVPPHFRDRNLMRAPGSFHRHSVDLARACPPLRRPQNDHRPTGPLLDGAGARPFLDPCDLLERHVERGRKTLVDVRRIVSVKAALYDKRLVPVSPEERDQLVVGNARQHGWAGDLVTVQMQDRQNRPVGLRV
jgi:hypothetical protein